MSELLRRLRVLFHRGQFERDLEEEMRHHIALAESSNRQFGNIALLKEDSRAMWTWTFWEQFAQDIRYGLRTMGSNKLFTTMAVLSLALGIGANTAIFSFMDAILLRTLPVHRPEELVVVKWHSKVTPAVIHGMMGTRYQEGKSGSVSPNYPFAAYAALQSNGGQLSTLFAYAGAWEINLSIQNQAETSKGEYVSGGYYSGLGVVPAAGRLIGEEDDRAGASPVAVITYDYWQRRFTLNPRVVGQTIRVNNIPVTVVGVSAPGFFGVDSSFSPAVFLPLHAAPALADKPAADEKRRFFDQNFYWVEMMGRLRPGGSIAQAQGALSTQFRHFAESTAVTAKEKSTVPELFLEEGAGGLDGLRRRYSKPLMVLMSMVGLILAIACANIANLLLARATARRREMAVRLSLGAGRMRVVRQLLTESVLLSLTGGLFGVLVAIWGIRSITWLLSNGRDNFTLHASLNWPVLAFTLALALITGVVFGLAPALQATKVDVAPALKESRVGASRDRSRIGLSHALVVSQIAISLLLIIAAGLFVHTLSNLHSIDLGFNRENLLIFSLNGRQAGYKDATLARFYADVDSRFQTIPGVRSVGASQFPLAAGYWNDTLLTLPGASKSPGHKLNTCIEPVDPSFLSTMQIPILLGRGLREPDLESPRVAVVTERFAKKFFPNQSPVGHRIGLGDEKNPADVEIVGVARTSRYNSVKEEDTPPVVYVPYTQNPADLHQMYFELRTAGDPLALAGAVRRTVHQISAGVPVGDFSTQALTIDETISQERTFADLCTCFAVLALVIACVGLYGTMAYTVARRTSEIGIRVALGAQRGRIVWMVLRELMALSAVGLAAGLAAAWQLSQFVKSFLFGLKPNDPVALGASVAILIACAIVAGYAPAWRASRIDPMAALRHE